MFTDPLTGVTVNSVALSLPKVDMKSNKVERTSVYQTADGSFKVLITQQTTQAGRIRSTVRIEQTAIVPDPITAVNDTEQLTFYCVIDRPLAGFTVAQVQQLVAGLTGFMTSANVARLYGQES